MVELATRRHSGDATHTPAPGGGDRALRRPAVAAPPTSGRRWRTDCDTPSSSCPHDVRRHHRQRPPDVHRPRRRHLRPGGDRRRLRPMLRARMRVRARGSALGLHDRPRRARPPRGGHARPASRTRCRGAQLGARSRGRWRSARRCGGQALRGGRRPATPGAGDVGGERARPDGVVVRALLSWPPAVASAARAPAPVADDHGRFPGETSCRREVDARQPRLDRHPTWVPGSPHPDHRKPWRVRGQTAGPQLASWSGSRSHVRPGSGRRRRPAQ